MTAAVLMLQGTSSTVGKSLVVAALCRSYARRGLRVAPFKAQNMSNNAAVCADGAEIGRSQMVQATAAGLAATALLNPILLKPESNSRTQIIVMGRPWRTIAAGTYYRHRTELWPVITRALASLRAQYDLVIIEGAGSPAELNLRAGDLVNMAVAHHAQAPVVLVGDIDRGGIFAQLLGTLWLLEASERALVKGLIVNKFHGETSLFADGVRILEARSQLPVLGVVPFMPQVFLPEEDAATLTISLPPLQPGELQLDIAIVHFPAIANFDDFAPLAMETGVHVRYVRTREALGHPQAIILPGTKSTMADLAWLRQQGLDRAIQNLAASGTAVVGICGGYQMLGHSINDPQGVESLYPLATGLGLLPVHTVFSPAKATHQITAQCLPGPSWLNALQGQIIHGYEIHMGHTSSAQPMFRMTRHDNTQGGDGCCQRTGHVWGCSIHGLFANTPFRRAWLRSLGWSGTLTDALAVPGLQDTLDTLATHVEASLDMTRLESIIWGG